jgi:hypothetical protein
MDDRTAHAALAFGATALLLSAVQGKSLSPVKTVETKTLPSGQGEISIQSTTAEDANYLAGFAVGAGSVIAAWYVWHRFKPHAYHALAPRGY